MYHHPLPTLALGMLVPVVENVSQTSYMLSSIRSSNPLQKKSVIDKLFLFLYFAVALKSCSFYCRFHYFKGFAVCS